EELILVAHGKSRATKSQRLEGQPRDEAAGALTVGARSRVNGAEAAAVQADVGAGIELHGLVREILTVRAQADPRINRAIKDIRELDAHVEAHAFSYPEVAAEVGVFHR